MAVVSLPLGGNSFWTSAASASDVYQDGDVLYVVRSDKARMHVLLRTATEMFQTTADNESRSRHLNVVVNGNFYDLTAGGKAKVFFSNSPVAASETIPIGLLVSGSHQIGGRPAPSLFYVANTTSQLYQFGFGDPPLAGTFAALGGLGPLILGGLKYGVGNLYKPGTPAGPATGQPPASVAGNLIQRNNATFEAAAKLGPRVGKVVIGHSSAAKKLIILVQPHGAATGISHNDLRDKLFSVGVDNAVFLDGSDSVLLLANGIWYVRPGQRKDQTNTIGVGFSGG